jgi:hypothetical protein
MAEALLRHATEHEVTKIEPNEQGYRYVIEGTLYTPDHRNPFVRTVWFIEFEQQNPQFVTAYPA